MTIAQGCKSEKWENVCPWTPKRILICTTYKELTKLNALKLIYEHENELDKQFSKEEIQIANKYSI